MDKYIESNRAMWDEWAALHEGSEFYDVAGFLKGRDTLGSIETEEVGDVSGKSLLHLMCHFGMDTLSWARRGAAVTGVDFSEAAIDIARRLSGEAGIASEFICSNVYDLPEKLDKKYDIVFTSQGILCWLPDLNKWAGVIAHFLKPGGFFYIYEGHPFLNMISQEDQTATGPEIIRSYFHSEEPESWESVGSYAGVKTSVTHYSHEWTHNLSDIIDSLIHAGLRIEFFHEHAKLFYPGMPYLKKEDDGYWHNPGDKIPLTFSLKAVKP